MDINEIATDEATDAESTIGETTNEQSNSDDNLDSGAKAVIAKERKLAREADKRARELESRLKEIEDRDKTDAQRLQEERDALKAERDLLHMENLRREVADEKGLTPAQARRLVGSTREELEADADDVIATFPVKAKPVFGDVGQGSRGESSQRVYTTAEINDFGFFQTHKDDILLAQREGRIVLT
jgi:hypothetical protein